ncbi:MAG: hypothetical protein KKF79_17855 [Gammaproteobacteria bacterium]|nr:hypothetical protein [Gammaproteobacteria bacterium]MBU2225336.1 hypothetical protein [Gammaproteobacteria bacterium]MBU2427651.1 hypothetical protein [Gammaproteobacteria bacterium]
MHLKICAVLILLTPAAFATSVDLKTQLQSCQQIAEEEQRLSCFDQIVSQLDLSATTEATSTAAAEKSVVPQPEEMKAKFGLKKPNREAQVQEISSLVKSTAFDLRKKLVITLENGQQWRQTDQAQLNIQAGDRCTVKRGALGSFLLGIEGVNKKIRVRRVE